MTDKKPVIVYGASGYTGRLVCEYLREFHVPFIAAGRDARRTQAVMDKIPGIETADYEVAEVEHSVEALTKLFDGAKVVSNMVGPFSKYGPEVVEACLAAGCHYTDTTGEQDWVLDAQDPLGRQVRGQGPAALARRRADVHDRRNRREHLPRNARARHARHPRAVEGLSDLCLDADDLRDPAGEVVLSRAEQIRRMGAEHPFRGQRSRPARARAGRRPGPAPRIPSGSRTIRASPTARRSAASSRARSWRASSRRRRCSRSRSSRCRPTSSRRRSPTSRHRFRPACRRAKIRASTSRSTSVYASGPLGARALRDPRQLQLQADRPAAGLRRLFRCCSRRRRRWASPRPVRPSGIANCSACCKSFGLVMNPIVTVHH